MELKKEVEVKMDVRKRRHLIKRLAKVQYYININSFKVHHNIVLLSC